MKSNIKLYRQRATDLKNELRAMLDKAAGESRDMNEAEGAAYEDKLKALKAASQSLEREEALLELERHTAAIEDQNEMAAAVAGAPTQHKGFASLGEQLQAVIRASRSGGHSIDPRLLAGPAGASEAVPSDGGFLVQKDFSAELLMRAYQTGQITSRCRKIPISGNANGLKINAIDEDSRADGSRWGGILAYWVNEAATLTGSKPKFRRIELQLEKLIALCYATDELLEDAAALEAVIQKGFAEEMVFKVEDAIINGTGAGQPLGILNSGALITQAKDAADTGAVLTTNDVLAMDARLWVPSMKSAVWLADVTVKPQLFKLVLGAPSLGQILLYTPPNSANEGVGGMLMGKPVIFHEHGAVLGTPGDFILADLDQYVMIDKGGVRQDYSIHVNFLTDEGVFRFVYRVDGEPWWKKPLTPKSGGSTLSPFIDLATRS
jgi:HK97 family phage major capsid protein